jgi:hypothetical protein
MEGVRSSSLPSPLGPWQAAQVCSNNLEPMRSGETGTWGGLGGAGSDAWTWQASKRKPARRTRRCMGVKREMLHAICNNAASSG